MPIRIGPIEQIVDNFMVELPTLSEHFQSQHRSDLLPMCSHQIFLRVFSSSSQNILLFLYHFFILKSMNFTETYCFMIFVPTLLKFHDIANL